jgi:hypothetical protein
MKKEAISDENRPEEAESPCHVICRYLSLTGSRILSVKNLAELSNLISGLPGKARNGKK